VFARPRWLGVGISTAAAMAAFAANSLLCRLALAPAAIDAASFTAIRFVSGALALLALASTSRGPRRQPGGDWTSAAVLLAYAVPFAFAYVRLNAGTGALVLFGAAQLSMIAAALWAGDRPSWMEWTGLAIALAGLVYLVFPGLTSSPSPIGVTLMGVAGVAWGLYSLLGRRVAAPLAATTGNFLRVAPGTLAVTAACWGSLHVSPRGAVLAFVSGAVTSAGGYIVWYQALRGLTATRAAVVQLSVPALAALGGTVFLAETLTLRLVLSAALILGGVGVSIAGRAR